jgi:hypothetical protein
MQVSPMENLPKSIVHLIFTFLNEYDLCTIASVSKLFLEVSTTNDLWRALSHAHGFVTASNDKSSNSNDSSDAKEKQKFRDAYQEALATPTYLIPTTLWHYPARRTPTVQVLKDTGITVYYDQGVSIRPRFGSNSMELGNPFCARCKRVQSSEVTVFTGFTIESGTIDYCKAICMEIYCRVCACYTKWEYSEFPVVGGLSYGWRCAYCTAHNEPHQTICPVCTLPKGDVGVPNGRLML